MSAVPQPSSSSSKTPDAVKVDYKVADLSLAGWGRKEIGPRRPLRPCYPARYSNFIPASFATPYQSIFSFRR